MINFPIFERLDIDGYGLFPGRENRSGLHVEFKPGLTLILGANGLGKTTLISILYRMLTGPVDIPGLSSRTELGNISLEPRNLPSSARSVFAQRVSDGAENAIATLVFDVGRRKVLVERRLRDLSLVRFSVGQRELNTDESESFQKHISKLVGVWSFGDWILLLRHLVFYFEDRRALVWDSSAQRQVLRLLLLPTDTARRWTEDERTILELDSRARNLSFAVFREEQALSENELRIQGGEDVRAELKALEELQSVDVAKRESLDIQLLDSNTRRQAARLRVLKTEQEREGRYRNLERAKLAAVEARFPKKSDTARYILAHLMTESECLVCGNHVPSAAAALEKRIRGERCVVCGSDLSTSQHVSASKVADRRVSKAVAELAAIIPELVAAQRHLAEAERDYETLVDQIAQLDASTSARSQRIDALVQRLPPAEAEVHKQRSELASMRSRLETLRKELDQKRRAFGSFVEDESRAMVSRSGAIKKSFERYAEGFLFEQCTLIWSPQKSRLGQTGEMVEFPAFELDMTGGTFASAVRRSGPEQVSESQREFIDLAFRMALMEVAGSKGAGSLVIDAPESSLDAVFVKRAAQVLARFADPDRGNRLAITSNLIEGKLIPSLLGLSSVSADKREHLLDLFEIAEPTAAIRELRSEYTSVLRKMLGQVERAARKKRVPTGRARTQG